MTRQLALITDASSGIRLGEVVITGVEDANLLQAAFAASLAAFDLQGPRLASRYVAGE